MDTRHHLIGHGFISCACATLLRRDLPSRPVEVLARSSCAIPWDVGLSHCWSPWYTTPVITVLGATGNTGSRIVCRLRKAGVGVRAVGRDAGRLEAAGRLGAEIWVGDTHDRAFLTRAFDGIDGAYVLNPSDLTMSGYAARQEAGGTAIAEALRAAGVPRVVALSAIGAELMVGTGYVTTLHDQEQRLSTVDTELLVLRPALYYEWFLPALPRIRAEGVHVDVVDPSVAVPMVATRDVADVAVTALLDGFTPGTLELLGPADHTFAEAVALIGDAIGVHPVSYKALPEKTMRPILVAAGLSAEIVELHLEMTTALSSGVIRPVVGRGHATTTPTTLDQWAADLAAIRS